MNKYKCAKCGESVFTADTLDKEEQGLLLCEECEDFEKNLNDIENHYE